MLGTQGTTSNAANRTGSLLGDGTDGTVEQLEQQIPINSPNPIFPQPLYSPTFSRQETFLMILLFHLFHWLCMYKIPPEYKTECH
jgi:hypothetical protein